VLDAKRYKEANPTNMPPGFDGLSPAILDKPLLKWEAGSESAVVGLHMEVRCKEISRYVKLLS
jgi:hypothetical protein